MFRNLCAALAILMAASPVLAGDTYTVDRSHSETSFRVRHMMGRVSGSFGDFSGTIQVDRERPEDSRVEFRIRTASIDTNNTRRDEHLRSPDFFDAAAHPEIVFTSTRVVPKGENQFEVHGNLTMRGVTKALVLPVTFLGEATDPGGRVKASWETSTTLNRKEYGIVWNRALDSGGFVLGDEVEVTINVQAARQQGAATQ
jgi:polyisoprenoid-binding protein YceI